MPAAPAGQPGLVRRFPSNAEGEDADQGKQCDSIRGELERESGGPSLSGPDRFVTSAALSISPDPGSC